jgi:hypothetical protein
LKTSASSQTKPDNFYDKSIKPDSFTYKQDQYKYHNNQQFSKIQHEKVNSLNTNNNIVFASIEDKFLGEELNMKLRGIKEKTRNAYYTLGLNKVTKENNLLDSFQQNKAKLFDTFDKQQKHTSITNIPEEKISKFTPIANKDMIEKTSLLKTIINKNISISSIIMIIIDKPKFEASQFKSKLNFGSKYVKEVDSFVTKDKFKISDFQPVAKNKLMNKKYF